MNDIKLLEKTEVITQHSDFTIEIYFNKQRKGQLDTHPIYQRDFLNDKKSVKTN